MSDAPVKAAGVMFLTPDDHVLLVRRRGGKASGYWAFPGGHLEDGETAEQAARREVTEETGYEHQGDLIRLSNRVADGVDFTTFLGKAEKFAPRLNAEHDMHIWADRKTAMVGMPLHPGVKAALARPEMDELGIAEAIRDGEITGPVRYQNVLLIALRITGTGHAYRLALDEHTWRDPSFYLNDRFVTRCNGLPVIVEHPDGVLNGQELRDRIVGTIMLPYVKDDEVWGIAKIYDEAAAQLLETEKLSTSPCITFRAADPGTQIQGEDGGTFLIEGKPAFADHLCLTALGVWDKGGEASGVSNQVSNSQQEPAPMADESKEEKREESKSDAEKVEAKADAEGDKIDRVLKHLDSLHKRLDASDARMDAYEKSRKDSEEEEEEEERADKKRKDSKRADAESDEKALEEEREENHLKKNDKKRKDSKRKDSEGCAMDSEKDEERADSRSDSAEIATLRQQLAELRAAMPKILPEEDRKKFAATQLEWEQVHQAFGDSQGAPRWANGEEYHEYARRLAGKFQQHSKTWKEKDLSKVDVSVLPEILGQIRSDALSVARNPQSAPGTALRMSEERDGTGRIIRKFYGDPMAVWSPFMQPYRHAVFNRPAFGGSSTVQ